ncbi:RNA polymerase sigma factor [Lewinella sp. LCG006]|uniref:RNA polymerase sigma factor n=1 Tax=Lewinella sp. LCG006 TaxID=3231911 RepID=UPI00345F77B9
MTHQEFNVELINKRSILFAFALKLTKDYQDAQDLFQDGTMRAFHYCSHFVMGTNFRAWMATIIRNTFINNFRENKRRGLVKISFERSLLYTESKSTLANQGEVNIRIQEIYGMLDEVDDKYSVPFLMHHQGYQYKEIGQALNLPIGTVKSRLYTARQVLQKKVNARN